MKDFILILFIVFISASCKNASNENQHVKKVLNQDKTSDLSENSIQSIVDTTFCCYNFENDSLFQLRIVRHKNEDNSSSLLLTFSSNYDIFKDTILNEDLVFDKMNTIEFRDINGDKIKDVLVLISSDGHNSNHYEVYLIDNKRHFTKIKAFSKLVNPQFISSLNLMKCEKAYRLAQTREEYFKWKGNEFHFINGSVLLRNSINEKLKYSKYSDKSVFLEE